ncbi:MAG TPA: DUF1924 domain-containing protein [Nitrospiria bacterium]|nr:DUF1924 domain-containing protein [Nitrospiria bacterium]
MKITLTLILPVLVLLGGVWPARASAIDDLLHRYRGEGADNFSAADGAILWKRPFADARSGQQRSCSTCHGTDLRRTGKHANTGKQIDPMAPSANPKRLTDAAFIEKWLSRNCKWTLGRACTPKEKGDFLLFLRGQ